MRCSKCNSPLISGEPFCKICGTKVEEKKDIEVIDFEGFDDDEEFVSEVLDNSEDLMDELDDVKLETTVSLEPVTLKEIENTPVEEGIVELPTKDKETKKKEPKNISIDLEEDEKSEMSQTLIDIMMKPIVLEDTIKIEQEEIKKEEEKVVALEEEIEEESTALEKVEEIKEPKEEKEEKKKEDKEPKKEKKKEPKEKDEEEEETLPLEDKKEVFKSETKKLPKKDVKTKEPDTDNRNVEVVKANNNKKGADLTSVILAIVLIVSIILNVYLFVTKGEDKQTEESETTTIVKTNKVVFDDYEISVNNGWIVSNIDNTLVLSDTSNEWVSKTIIVADSDYDSFVSNVDEFVEQVKDQKYQFTSNYEKKVDGTKVYLFKGKIESYTTYLIVSAVDKETLSVTELKFENEVNDKTLDKVMSTITSIDVTNSSFEALDSEKLTTTVQENSKLEEETDDTKTTDKETTKEEE